MPTTLHVPLLFHGALLYLHDSLLAQHLYLVQFDVTITL
jgi:hypothetical protein